MARYQCIFEDSMSIENYNRLRFIPESVCNCFGEIIVQLSKNIQYTKGETRILDAGVGTGRFAIPCCRMAENMELNVQLLGVDLSHKILKRLQNIWEKSGLRSELQCIRADLQEPLKIPSNSIDVVYTVATFHILDRWRAALDNLIKVIIPGGYLVFVQEINQFMHQTEGFDKDSDLPQIHRTLKDIMKYYHKLRREYGEPYKPSEIRYSDITHAIKYLHESGLKDVDIEINASHLSWEKPHSYDEILHCFRRRQMTTWGSELSETTRDAIADLLDTWVANHELDREKEFLLPARLVTHIFKKSPAT